MHSEDYRNMKKAPFGIQQTPTQCQHMKTLTDSKEKTLHRPENTELSLYKWPEKVHVSTEETGKPQNSWGIEQSTQKCLTLVMRKI